MTSPSTDTEATPNLVTLLGGARATIVETIRRDGPRTASQLAEVLGTSDVAVRKHLAVLESEDLVSSEIVHQPRGRPASTYSLTDRARSLFPQRYAEVANELLAFIDDTQGREGIRAYLRWRMDRQSADYEDVVTAEDLHDRLEQLAGALCTAGYAATVDGDETSFTLRQDHCAIHELAQDHPELCAYEAATFKKVLGDDVTLSRRETIATGASACVCTVTRTADDG